MKNNDQAQHITADIQLRFAPPKCSASPRTSYVRIPLAKSVQFVGRHRRACGSGNRDIRFAGEDCNALIRLPDRVGKPPSPSGRRQKPSPIGRGWLVADEPGEGVHLDARSNNCIGNISGASEDGRWRDGDEEGGVFAMKLKFKRQRSKPQRKGQNRCDVSLLSF